MNLFVIAAIALFAGAVVSYFMQKKNAKPAYTATVIDDTPAITDNVFEVTDTDNAVLYADPIVPAIIEPEVIAAPVAKKAGTARKRAPAKAATAAKPAAKKTEAKKVESTSTVSDDLALASAIILANESPSSRVTEAAYSDSYQGGGGSSGGGGATGSWGSSSSSHSSSDYGSSSSSYDSGSSSSSDGGGSSGGGD